MTIRELLQIEIWSKRTSRRILIGLGIVTAIVVIGFVLWNTLNERFITPSERKAASAALAQIETLQDFNRMSDAEYDAGALQAKQEMDRAEQAAWTSQDKRIAFLLLGYFEMTDTKRFHLKHKIPTDSRSEYLDKRVFEFTKGVLHRVLD
jgi:hypothetical protein